MTENDRKFISYIITRWEGGYSNHPDDSGGETCYGITKKYFPNEFETIMKIDKKLDYAIRFYYKNFMSKLNGLPKCLKYFLTDFYINAGNNAIRVFQMSIKQLGQFLDINGVFGEQTKSAANKINKNILLKQLYKNRKEYYWLLNKPVFIKGWINRTQDIYEKVKHGKWHS